MGWNYQDYQAAPQWFIDAIVPLAEVEQKVAKIKADNDAARQKQGL